jgi:hypothetical protein
MFESKINRGKANGYAPLDGSGKVPLDKLPPIQSPIDTGSFAITGSNSFDGEQTISGSLMISGSGSLNGNNLVSSNTINKIETITSSSYASITPVSGTMYVIID